uniref:Uncharacterized protein n=1 Tax=Anguilla anguilla TaxID=7936 RepID=A0A0E9WC10_ANGAN
MHHWCCEHLENPRTLRPSRTGR